MPKVRITAPLATPYTDERLAIPDAMVDEDNMQYGVEAQFKEGADLQEGLSGKKSIDASFENTSEATVDSPRSGNAPVQVNKYDYPHRGY